MSMNIIDQGEETSLTQNPNKLTSNNDNNVEESSKVREEEEEDGNNEEWWTLTEETAESLEKKWRNYVI